MIGFRNYILLIFISILSLNYSLSFAQQKTKDFIVVIDPGHGGHDPGAVGKTAKEKNINLNVALKVGNLIKRNNKDVKVIYTRDRDVFIPLLRRAEIANNAKADLFISIHTNSVAKNKVVKGTSTWTLGLSKSKENLAVAQRENAVILYENDYKTRYAGFNPNSAESYIIFEFMQDKHMEQSVHLASLVQRQFKNRCKRIDKGVHQAEFLVLKESAMPSILIELGFISTPEEERYLTTESGTTNLANGIYHAFIAYKREHEIRLTGSSQTVIPEENASGSLYAAEKEVVTQQMSNKQETSKSVASNNNTSITTGSKNQETIFKVQILAAASPIKPNDKIFKGLQNVDSYKEKGMYKYTYGASTDYNKVLQTQRNISAKFKGAFIVAFKGGQKINTNEAIAEFKKKQNKK